MIAGGFAAMEFPPEDILAEILLRLPEKTLFRFKCVSKQWRSFISDPNFADHYIENSRSSPESWIVHCRLLSWPSFGPDIDSGVHQGKILASSNGLILSTPDPNAVTNLELHVSNPLTNQSAQLPLLSCPFSQCAFGFVQNLGTYKVVVIQRAVGPDLAGSLCSSIEMFDSETGRWSSKKEHVSCPEVLLDYNGEKREGFAYKGVVHWLQLHCGSRTIVTYDPYNSPGRFGRIELPESSGMLGVLMTQLCRRGSSLRYGELVELNYAACGLRKFRMRVWRLEEYGGGEWVPEEQRICTKSNGGGSGYQFVCRPVGKEDAEEVLQLYNRRSFRSVVMCPWSSPLYGIPR